MTKIPVETIVKKRPMCPACGARITIRHRNIGPHLLVDIEHAQPTCRWTNSDCSDEYYEHLLEDEIRWIKSS